MELVYRAAELVADTMMDRAVNYLEVEHIVVLVH